MNAVQTLLASIRSRGIGGTLAFVVSMVFDCLFDLRYGTDTMTWAALRDLDVLGANLARGVDYEPTQVYPLKRLLRTLSVPKDKVLVDLGCGKGRVLMVASWFGFADVRGVEFASELYETAVKNCMKFSVRTKSKARFKLFLTDVVDYPIEDEDLFFLFNPFDEHVLGQVLHNIEKSLAARDRRIWVIYRNPLCRSLLEATRIFQTTRIFNFMGSDFSVFIHAPADTTDGGTAHA